MAETDQIAIVDFLKEHLPTLKALAADHGVPDKLPGPGDLPAFERAQMKVIQETLEKLIKPKEADTFDEEEDDGGQDPIVFTSTMPGLVAGKRFFKDQPHVVMVPEDVWREWVKKTFGSSKPILRGFKRYFCYFTSVLGELELKEQVSGMRLKGIQYIQLHEGNQLTLATENKRVHNWGWDSAKLEPGDEDDED